MIGSDYESEFLRLTGSCRAGFGFQDLPGTPQALQTQQQPPGDLSDPVNVW